MGFFSKPTYLEVFHGTYPGSLVAKTLIFYGFGGSWYSMCQGLESKRREIGDGHPTHHMESLPLALS